MTGFRESAWLREAHDRAECPSECPICSRIDAHEGYREERLAHDHYVTSDWEDR